MDRKPTIRIRIFYVTTFLPKCEGIRSLPKGKAAQGEHPIDTNV